MKEDAESWRNFLRQLKQRGLTGVRLIVSDKSLELGRYKVGVDRGNWSVGESENLFRYDLY